MRLHNCPKCGNGMVNLGSIDGVIMTTSPAQFSETWVCHDCKVKKTVGASTTTRKNGAPRIENYVSLGDELDVVYKAC